MKNVVKWGIVLAFAAGVGYAVILNFFPSVF